MCGRFALFASGEELRERYPFVEDAQIEPRYNIAPTQPVKIVRETDMGREMVSLRWGLIPSWARDPTTTYPLINARAETVAQKPSFRAAFKQRRCLIPASGYYEWQKTDGSKQPHFIRPHGGGLFAFAGLWEGETCTILTTTANDLMRPLHERMPVILDPTAEALWLDTRADAISLHALLVPYPGEKMEAFPVSPWVSNPKYEGPLCLERVGA
jgi:putative SOS response-associated peptidase YedK